MNPNPSDKAEGDSVSDKALMEAAMQVDETVPVKIASLSKVQKQKRKKARQDAKRARRRNRKQ